MNMNLESSLRAARVLEAMRLGVVPSASLDAYTVGREAELALAQADFRRATEDGGAVRAFLGDYGSGKTHLLELIGQHALRQNFLVSHVVLNPEETAPSHPKRVYRELINSLRYPDCPDSDGLQPLLQAALQSRAARAAFQCDASGPVRKNLDKGAHLYLTTALRYLRRLAEQTHLDDAARQHLLRLLFDWLEGHPTVATGEINEDLRGELGNRGHIFSMKDYRPWARIYGYLLSGLSAMARQLGYSGWVILVDEAEFYSLLSSENREYARILFKALAWASVGDAGDLLPFDRAELSLGGSGILQRLPPQYPMPEHPESPNLAGPGLYTVFAMTPNTEGIEALGEAVPTHALAELNALTLDDYQALVTRVFDYYRRARPESLIDERVAGALGKVVAGLLGSGYVENPRQAMKFIVEFLDLATHRPYAMKQVVQDLRSLYA